MAEQAASIESREALEPASDPNIETASAITFKLEFISSLILLVMGALLGICRMLWPARIDAVPPAAFPFYSSLALAFGFFVVMVFSLPRSARLLLAELSAGKFSLQSIKFLIKLVCIVSVMSASFVWPVFISQAWWWSPAVFAGLVCFELLERASNVLRQYFIGLKLSNMVSKVRLETNEQSPAMQLSDVRKVRVGQAFGVQSGQIIPLDGVVRTGSAFVTERCYSGLEELRAKSVGMEVFAGSTVLSGELHCQVSNNFEDSTVTSVWERLNQICSVAPEGFKYVNLYRSLATAVLTILAVGVGIYSMQTGLTWQAALASGAAVLSCGLLLSALDFVAILPNLIVSNLFRRGVLVSGLDIIKNLGGLKCLLVDYEPEHALGQLRVSQYQYIDENICPQTLDAIVFFLLSSSEEPWAGALRCYLEKRLDTKKLLAVQDVRMYARQGICGSIQGAEFTVGKEDFLLQRGVRFEVSEASHDLSGQHLYVALNQNVVGHIRLESALEEELASLCKGLKHANVRVCLGSPEQFSVMEERAKRIGLSTTDIFPCLSRRDLNEKLLGLQPLALLSDQRHSMLDGFRGSVGIFHFNELAWNLESPGVALFGPNLNELVQVFKLARISNRIPGVTKLLTLYGGTLLLVLAGLGLMSPLMVLLLIFLAMTALLYCSPERPFALALR